MRRQTAARHRAEAQVRRIGAEIHLAQSVLGLSNRSVALLAGVATSTVGRIHAGDGGVQTDTLAAVTAAVGLELSVRGFPGREPSLRDTGQLEIAEMLHSVAHPAWQVQLEVAAGEHGRSADLVALGPVEVIHVEIERRLVQFEGQYRSALRKREALAAQHARPIRLVLAVEDTHHNRRVLEPHSELVRVALPAGTREVMRAIRSGRSLGRDGLLWVRRRTVGRPAPAADRSHGWRRNARAG